MKTNSDRRAVTRVVCFDFDGTVADTMPFLTEIAVDVLVRHCGLAPGKARSAYVRTTGLPFAEQARQICNHHGQAALNAAVAEFEARKQAGYLEHAPVAHAGETIAELQRRGYQVAISSSTPEALIAGWLARHRLAPDLVLGLRPGFRKGRDHFDHIQSACSVPAAAVCFVADSLNDLHLARENGVDFIGKCGLFSAADFRQLDAGVTTIDSLQDLLAIF